MACIRARTLGKVHLQSIQLQSTYRSGLGGAPAIIRRERFSNSLRARNHARVTFGSGLAMVNLQGKRTSSRKDIGSLT